MQYYIQIDKKTKRVKGYSSNATDSKNLIEFVIDKKDLNKYKNVLNNPFYVFDELTKKFSIDEEYKKELMNRKTENSKDEKYNNVMQLLIEARLDSIKKDNLLNILLKERALNRLQNIKKEGNINA